MKSISWSTLLAQLELVVSRSGSRGIDQHKESILSMLREYRSDESDFKDYIHYDDSGYTKNLVKEIGTDCNVIVMCWAPNQSSAFHAHEGSKCFVKVLMGQLMEQQVTYPNLTKSVSTTQNRIDRLLSRDDVSYIDDSIGAHRVFNQQIDRPAITLHIYSPPYKNCRIFEDMPQETISIGYSSVREVTFHSKFGSHE